MFECPSCGKKGIETSEKLACSEKQPAVCLNCGATCWAAQVTTFTIIAGLVLSVLLFIPLTMVAFTEGMTVAVGVYIVFLILATVVAAIIKIFLPLKIDDKTE